MENHTSKITDIQNKIDSMKNCIRSSSIITKEQHEYKNNLNQIENLRVAISQRKKYI